MNTEMKMEKRKLSGKTILKLAGALLTLAYLGFCLYAGITGKFSEYAQSRACDAFR